MGFAFNPFTGNFDVKGAGGGGGASYIDGEVATYADLPLDGTAPLNSAWLVRTASGVWPVSRKQAGIYIRTATGGSSRDADYTYAGTMPDVFSDSVFLLYDEASTTRTGQFNLGSITAGQNRVLTWPDASGTLVLGNDSRISNIAANSITTAQGANSGGAGGTITMRGGVTGSNHAGGNAGSINLRGSDDREEGAFNGGSIDLSALNGTGGSITSVGNSEYAGGSLNMSSGGTGAGGSINTSNAGGSINTSTEGGTINTSSGGGTINTSGLGGSINTSNSGGAINTSGGENSSGGSMNTSGSQEYNGGSINTSGGEAQAGGSINTSNGGGSIDTRGTGSVGLGVSGTRTTITGTATADRAISLPNAGGTLALTQQDTDYEVTDETKGVIMKSPNGTRWRVTIDNNGSLLRTAIALLLSAFLMCGAQAQVRDLVYGTNNVVIGPTNTNALSFTNRVSLPISSGAATTNSILTADGAGGSAFVASRTVTRFTTNDQTKTNWGFPNLTQATNNDPQIGSFAIDANSVYRVDFVVAFRAATNASFRCGVSFATNLADISQRAGFFQSANTTITALNMPTNAINLAIQNDPGGNTNHSIAGLFYIYSGTNANSMTFRWYPANNTNIACNLLSNTMISVTKMSP